MEFKQLDDAHILVRLDPKDEIISALLEVKKTVGWDIAAVQGLGAVNRVVMGLYHVAEQKYASNTFSDAYEMVSLTGTLDTMGKEPYAHLHIVIADGAGHAFGGHLNEAIISATAEIVLTRLNGKIDREKSPTVGLNIWKF